MRLGAGVASGGYRWLGPHGDCDEGSVHVSELASGPQSWTLDMGWWVYAHIHFLGRQPKALWNLQGSVPPKSLGICFKSPERYSWLECGAKSRTDLSREDL